MFYHSKMCLTLVEQGEVTLLDIMAIGWVFLAFDRFIIP